MTINTLSPTSLCSGEVQGHYQYLENLNKLIRTDKPQNLFGRGRAVGILFPKLCHMWAEHQLSGSYHNTRQHAGEDLMYNLMVKKRGSHFNDIFARYFICPGETGYWNVNFLIKKRGGLFILENKLV